MLWMVCCLLAQNAISEYKLGLQAYSNDELRTAESHLRTARQQAPNLFEVRFLLGATLVRLNQGDEAIAELEAAHRIDPKHLDVVKLLAIQYKAAGRQQDALHMLESALEDTRDEELYLLLIEANQDVGSVDQGTRLVQMALRRYPNSARLNAWMGFELRESGQFDEATRYLRRAIKLDPRLVAPYFLMGDVLLQDQNYRAAEPWLRQALKIEPRDVGAAIDLSKALAGLGDLRGAAAELEKEWSLSQDDARLALEMARLYARLGDQDRAKRHADLAVRLRVKESAVPESLRH